MSMGYVMKKSLVKAIRDVAITVLTVGFVGGLGVLMNPEVLAPIATALPTALGGVVLLVVPILAKAAIDAIKHRGKMG